MLLSSSTAGDGGSGLDSKSVKASLLMLLEERQREAELWLQMHHEALRQAVELALPALPVPTGEAATATSDNLFSCSEHQQTLDDTRTSDRGDTLEASKMLRASEEASQRGSRGSHGDGGLESATDDEAVAQRGMCDQMSKEKRTTLLETGTGILIVLNTLVMFVQLEVNGRKGNEALHNNTTIDSSDDTDTTDTFFSVLNHVFNAIFLSELLIKLSIYRSKYFQSAFDCFDLAVVLVTSIDLYIVSHISQSTSNVSFLRALRMLRLARLLRIIRMMNFFQQLRVLMHTMVLSFLSVFWSMLILLLFMLVSSLLLSQLVQDFIVEGSPEDLKTREWANRYYGTSSKSLYTIFEATFSGCWPNYARNLIENVSPWYAAFFVPYVTLVIFTLIRLIYALLLKDTLQAAANDANLVVQDKMKEAKGLIKKLSDLFAEADVSQDGYLGREEFEKILAYPKVQTWMNALGLNTQDTDQLFSILDDGENPDGKISQKAFVNGIMRMKGHAQKQDLLVSARDTHRILNHCKVLQTEVLSLGSLLRTQMRLSDVSATSCAVAAAT